MMNETKTQTIEKLRNAEKSASSKKQKVIERFRHKVELNRVTEEEVTRFVDELKFQKVI